MRQTLVQSQSYQENATLGKTGWLPWKKYKKHFKTNKVLKKQGQAPCNLLVVRCHSVRCSIICKSSWYISQCPVTVTTISQYRRNIWLILQGRIEMV